MTTANNTIPQNQSQQPVQNPQAPQAPTAASLGRITINNKVYSVEVVFLNEAGRALAIDSNFDDFMQLNDKMQKAREDLKSILEDQKDRIGNGSIKKLSKRGIEVLDTRNNRISTLGFNTIGNSNPFATVPASFKDLSKTLIDSYVNSPLENIRMQTQVSLNVPVATRGSAAPNRQPNQANPTQRNTNSNQAQQESSRNVYEPRFRRRRRSNSSGNSHTNTTP